MDKLIEFLKESNAIEDVWDKQSLKDAVAAWNDLILCDTFIVESILDAHKTLMGNQPIAKSDKGAWRTCGVAVGGRVCPEVYAVPALMDGWIGAANVLPRTDEDIKRNHISFEHIHPFVDGNGRIGRILMNWQRVKSGLDVLVIKESEKQEYYEWFEMDVFA